MEMLLKGFPKEWLNSARHDYHNPASRGSPLRAGWDNKGKLYAQYHSPRSDLTLRSIFDQVDWADLDAVDLSKAKTHEGRKGLVKQVHDAMKNDGFLFVTNHSVTPQQVCSYVKPPYESHNVPRCLECLIFPTTLLIMSATRRNRIMLGIWEKTEPIVDTSPASSGSVASIRSSLDETHHLLAHCRGCSRSNWTIQQYGLFLCIEEQI